MNVGEPCVALCWLKKSASGPSNLHSDMRWTVAVAEGSGTERSDSDARSVPPDAVGGVCSDRSVGSDYIGPAYGSAAPDDVELSGKPTAPDAPYADV